MQVFLKEHVFAGFGQIQSFSAMMIGFIIIGF